MAHVNSDRIIPKNIVTFGWSLTIYEESTDPQKPSFDRAQVIIRDEHLSLLTLDAAVNIRIPGHNELSNHTLAVTMDSIQEFGIAYGADVAAKTIFNPEEPARNRNGIIALAGVQLGTLDEAWRCGDCEVWVKKDEVWENIFPDDMLSQKGRADYVKAAAGLSEYEAWLVQETVLQDLAMWTAPMIGLSDKAEAQYADISGAEEIIITSDGAQMTSERASNLAKWMIETIHIAPEGHPYPSPHGDLSVIHAKRL